MSTPPGACEPTVAMNARRSRTASTTATSRRRSVRRRGEGPFQARPDSNCAIELGTSAPFVPDHVLGSLRGQQDLGGAPLVDVADEHVVDAVPDQLLEPPGHTRHSVDGDAELLVLLLA